MTVERTMSVSRSGIDDFHEALAWAVQAYDREFGTATMVHLVVQQTSVLELDGVGEWHYQWTAAVSGSLEQAKADS